MVTLAIVDDQQAEAVAEYAKAAGFTVPDVLVVTNHQTLLDHWAQAEPDFVLVDVIVDGPLNRNWTDMKRISRHAEKRGAMVYAISSSRLTSDVYDALVRGGASGFLRKAYADEEFTRELQRMRDGESVGVRREDLSELIYGHEGFKRRFGRLPKRQVDVLRMVADGMDWPEIGRTLGIKPATARRYMTMACDNLGLVGPNAALRHLAQHAIPPGPPPQAD